METPANPVPAASNFIRDFVEEDLKSGKHQGKVVTRFPPEPNGYLHIGHAKSICLNFGLARQFGGRTHLRMDDTNPVKEEQEYIDAIKRDVRWLGFDWGEHEFHASDYFQQLYDWAVLLIKGGKAFVCDLTGDQIREHRGTLTERGRESPFRHRTVEENLDLFVRMKKGEFPDGSRTLRAKIDMGHANLNFRDPVLYRILHAEHPRTGAKWCIYPMYDYAHGQSDWIEGITHSICTLEFEDHRPLYDWFIDQISALGGALAGIPYRPRQYEFARLNMTHTVMSKRKFIELVKGKYVSGWDDPRMPTLAGLRRRGFTPEAIRDFAERIGVAKANSTVDVALLENCVREDLNRKALRKMAVLNPLKVVIENYPEGQSEELEAINNPEDPSAGTRKIPFSRVLYIDQDDFREDPPKGFYRLSPGKEVRLKFAYYIKCTGVKKDPVTGQPVELTCTYDPETRGGTSKDGRKVKGTSHWVSAGHALPAEVRLYEHLFLNPTPTEDPEYLSHINPKSLEVLKNVFVEPSVGMAKPGDHFQFERTAYFNLDPDSRPGALVFNRIVTMRDTWAKVEKKGN